jgi:hypothetical protein
VAHADPGEAEGRTKARTVLCPTVGAACAARTIEPSLTQAIPIEDLVEELAAQVKAVQDGGLGRREALLVAQAHTLDLLFNRLTRRAMGCDTIPPFEANMRMALRAQSQCTRTLEVLAAMKNPPVVIVRQANVTTGPQQNNFGVSRGESEIKPTEPLEQAHGERLDTGATVEAVGDDPALETVGAKHGA